MSSAAAWSYTAKATLWPQLSRHASTRAAVFGLPEYIDCDYGAESAPMTSAGGDPVAVNQVIYTERGDIKPGDMILIGISTETNPVAAGAREVRAKERFADTLDRIADDYKYGTN